MGTFQQKFYKGITFGIEFTYLFRDNPRQDHASYFAGPIQDTMRRRRVAGRAFSDGGALEINSPPFETLVQAERYFRRMEEVVKEYPLVARPDPKFNVCGGGGHIHMRPHHKTQASQAKLYAKLARFLTLHPYIAWVFNEPGDHITAMNFNKMLWDYKNYGRGAFSGFEFLAQEPNQYDLIRKEWAPHNPGRCVGGKSWVMRYDPTDGRKPGTFEFRAFDAKDTFEDVADHLSFMNSLVAHVDRLKSVPVSQYNRQGKLIELGRKDRGIDGFRKVIRELELPQKNYERFYPNFYRRAKLGYLT